MKVSVDTDSTERLEHPEYPGVFVTVRSILCGRSRKWRIAEQNRIKRRNSAKSGDATDVFLRAERLAGAGAIDKIEGADEFTDVDEETLRKAARDPRFNPFFDGVVALATDIGAAESESREESLGD